MALHAWPRGGCIGCERRRPRVSFGSSTAHGTPRRVHFPQSDRRFSDSQNPKLQNPNPQPGRAISPSTLEKVRVRDEEVSTL